MEVSLVDHKFLAILFFGLDCWFILEMLEKEIILVESLSFIRLIYIIFAPDT
jgi:hypothetical protein